MPEAFLVGGVRTPVGRYGGALAGVRPDDLASLVVGEVIRRSRLDEGAVEAGAIDEVILGAANQAGEDNRNVARMSVLLAGLPDSVPGITVNRLCASGMSAIIMAAQAQLGPQHGQHPGGEPNGAYRQPRWNEDEGDDEFGPEGGGEIRAGGEQGQGSQDRQRHMGDREHHGGGRDRNRHGGNGRERGQDRDTNGSDQGEAHQPLDPLAGRPLVEAGVFFGRADQHAAILARHQIADTVHDDVHERRRR